MTDHRARDSLGRCRAPGQDRGLRPLYPPLPAGMESRSVRVAMTTWAWARLEALLEVSGARTRPRAIGELVERSMAGEAHHDWQDWQIRKERQLLERAHGEAIAS